MATNASTPASLVTSRRGRGHAPAFTLVELLVSVSVLALLVALLSGSLQEVGKAWTRGEGNAERRGDARALTDFLASELQGALLPVSGSVGSSAQGNLQFLVNPASNRLPEACQLGDSIFWQAPLATDTTYGDIAILGYFIDWSGKTPSLCRLYIPPAIRNESGRVKNPDFLIYDANPDAWLDAELLARNVAPAEKASGYRGLFAENVPGFWVRCHGLDGQLLPRDFDSRVGYDCQYRPEGHLSYTEKRQLPATASISLAQVDSRHAHQLEQASAELQGILADPGVVDATTFLARVRAAADSSSTLAALLPGLRIYTTEINLLNAR